MELSWTADNPLFQVRSPIFRADIWIHKPIKTIYRTHYMDRIDHRPGEINKGIFVLLVQGKKLIQLLKLISLSLSG